MKHADVVKNRRTEKKRMITIREMQIDDLEQVMPIEEANFSIPWTETGFFTFLIRDDALFLVAEEDGEILGYLGILISFDESEITKSAWQKKREDAASAVH